MDDLTDAQINCFKMLIVLRLPLRLGSILSKFAKKKKLMPDEYVKELLESFFAYELLNPHEFHKSPLAIAEDDFEMGFFEWLKTPRTYIEIKLQLKPEMGTGYHYLSKLRKRGIAVRKKFNKKEKEFYFWIEEG